MGRLLEPCGSSRIVNGMHGILCCSLEANWLDRWWSQAMTVTLRGGGHSSWMPSNERGYLSLFDMSKLCSTTKGQDGTVTYCHQAPIPTISARLEVLVTQPSFCVEWQLAGRTEHTGRFHGLWAVGSTRFTGWREGALRRDLPSCAHHTGRKEVYLLGWRMTKRARLMCVCVWMQCGCRRQHREADWREPPCSSRWMVSLLCLIRPGRGRRISMNPD